MIPLTEQRLPVYQPTWPNSPPLFGHQLALVERWSHPWRMGLLEAPHGSGKTAAYVLPLVLRGDSAIIVHTTNAAIAEQTLLVEEATAWAGRAATTWAGEKTVPDGSDYLIAIATGDTLRGNTEEHEGRTLASFTPPTRPTLLLTNIDVLYGALKTAGGPQLLEGFSSLIIDDLQSYSAAGLARLLVLCMLVNELHPGLRILFADAALPESARELFTRAFDLEILPTSAPPGAVPRGEQTYLYPIDVTVQASSAGDLVEQALSLILDEPATATVAIFFRSPADARVMEEYLVSSGVPRERVVRRHSLTSRRDDPIRAGSIILASAAAEFAHFRCDTVIFEAAGAAQFARRLARAGRACAGRAIALLTLDQAKRFAVEELRAELPIDSRPRLEALARQVFGDEPMHAWFCETYQGMLTVLGLAATLQDVWSDPRSNSAVSSAVDRYAQQLGLRVRRRQAERKLNQAPHIQDTLRQSPMFRLNLPAVRIYDRPEARQGDRSGMYLADLHILLTRGELIHRSRFGTLYLEDSRSAEQRDEERGNVTTRASKQPKATSAPYERWHRVWISFGGSLDMEANIGRLLATAQSPRIQMTLFRTQEGQPMVLSDVLNSPEGHLFVIVPAEVADTWPLRTFAAGSGNSSLRVAIDGDALLASALYDRHQELLAYRQ